MVLDDIKRILLLTIAAEIKKTKLKLKPVKRKMANNEKTDDKRAIAIHFPEKLREIKGQFGAIQCNKNNVELRFFVDVLEGNLSDTIFLKTINEIDINKKQYRVMNKGRRKLDGKGEYIAFQFDKFDPKVKKFIENICEQVHKAFNQFNQKEYDGLDNEFEELKCIFDLLIFKDFSIQETIQLLEKQSSDFNAVIQYLQRFKQDNTDLNIVAKPLKDNYIELESLVTTVPEQVEITETEKEQVIKSRIGQSTFKKALLAIEKKCRLCGVTDERFLVASHIKPWSQSNNQERLDVNNGLLLCPNHDALFDKGYISFDDEGSILISDSLDEAAKVFLNINETMNIRMNEGQQQYMKWHRVYQFKN